MNFLQYLQTSKVNHDLNYLSEGLAEFGLCPHDWSLIKEDSLNYKITNKTEPKFYFRGRIHFKNGKRQWLSIRLVSL